GGRPLDNFARSDLIGDGTRQHRNGRQLPVLPVWRRSWNAPALFSALNVLLLLLHRVENLFRALGCHAGNWTWTRRFILRVLRLGLRLRIFSTTAASTTPAATVLLLFSERKLIVPFRVEIIWAECKRAVINRTRAVERRVSGISLQLQSLVEINPSGIEWRTILHFRVSIFFRVVQNGNSELDRIRPGNHCGSAIVRLDRFFLRLIEEEAAVEKHQGNR